MAPLPILNESLPRNGPNLFSQRLQQVYGRERSEPYRWTSPNKKKIMEGEPDELPKMIAAATNGVIRAQHEEGRDSPPPLSSIAILPDLRPAMAALQNQVVEKNQKIKELESRLRELEEKTNDKATRVVDEELQTHMVKLGEMLNDVSQLVKKSSQSTADSETTTEPPHEPDATETPSQEQEQGVTDTPSQEQENRQTKGYNNNVKLRQARSLLLPRERNLDVKESSKTKKNLHPKEVLLRDAEGKEGMYFGGIMHMSTGMMPHGKGRMEYTQSNRSYSGEWKHGMWHGRGNLIDADCTYKGSFEEGKRHGYGVFRWSDGRRYDGMFWKNQCHGHGTLSYPDGAHYEGDFWMDERHGKGKYRFAQGGSYDGMWKNGKFDGFGMCVWEDGRVYVGEWEKGMAHGLGKETYPSGKVRHEGLFRNDEPVRE